MTTEEFNTKAAGVNIEKKQQQGKTKGKQISTRSQTATSSTSGLGGIPPTSSGIAALPSFDANGNPIDPGQIGGNKPRGDGDNHDDDNPQQEGGMGNQHQISTDLSQGDQSHDDQTGDTLIALA
ncbi:uncharacterized protein MELLADRAFT_64633 [Melampsora larici-populina 98AG31]|uniref:Uncharacterized protein n=1 Tax=Melampsora larici-populina (strain 98AG31 / pathotype 3-4-7) TaxID=747676 RepID=F4RS68_MELLP|nr:uncharacterized protein MELLADRAFT_64633 [Melampsora larici-populina 98AG31]EGG04803.1 hypothetical protein MELLADRAFT_64633 [Melampsora larici-populina 98AG31]